MSLHLSQLWSKYLGASIPWQEATAHSADGSCLTYQVIGDAPQTIVLIPGMVPTLSHFPIIQHFRQRFCFLTWHTRGTFSSQTPDSHPSRWRIEAQVEDVQAVLAATQQVSPVLLLGWGVATQVCLEFARYYPRQCRGLVLLNGAPGAPLTWSGRLGRGLARLTQLRAWLPGAGGVSWLTYLLRLLTRLDRPVGLLSPTYSLWMDVGDLFLAQPAAVIHALLQTAQNHTAEPYLPSLQLPSLVTLAPQDLLPGPAAARRLYELLPQSTLFAWKRAGHYAPVLQPEPLNTALSGFFDALL